MNLVQRLFFLNLLLLETGLWSGRVYYNRLGSRPGLRSLWPDRSPLWLRCAAEGALNLATLPSSTPPLPFVFLRQILFLLLRFSSFFDRQGGEGRPEREEGGGRLRVRGEGKKGREESSPCLAAISFGKRNVESEAGI